MNKYLYLSTSVCETFGTIRTSFLISAWYICLQVWFLCRVLFASTSAITSVPWVRSVSLNRAWRRMWAIAPVAVLCVKAAARSLKSAAWMFWKWWKAPLRCLDKTGPSRPIIATFPKATGWQPHLCSGQVCTGVKMGWTPNAVPFIFRSHNCPCSVLYCASHFHVGSSRRSLMNLSLSDFTLVLNKKTGNVATCVLPVNTMLFSEAFIFICSSLSVLHSFFPTFLYSRNVKLDFFDVIYEASPLLREYIW